MCLLSLFRSDANSTTLSEAPLQCRCTEWPIANEHHTILFAIGWEADPNTRSTSKAKVWANIRKVFYSGPKWLLVPALPGFPAHPCVAPCLLHPGEHTQGSPARIMPIACPAYCDTSAANTWRRRSMPYEHFFKNYILQTYVPAGEW